jgi:hypothetical protein
VVCLPRFIDRTAADVAQPRRLGMDEGARVTGERATTPISEGFLFCLPRFAVISESFERSD